MNERDENIIVCLAASAGVYAAILHSIKSSKRKGECGSRNGYWDDKRKEHIMELFQTFA